MRAQRGVTLLELLVVVVIVGILAAVGVPQFFKSIERSRAAEAVHALGAIRNAELAYRATNGVYTTSVTDLDLEGLNLTSWTVTSYATQTDPQAASPPLATAQRMGSILSNDTIVIEINTGKICTTAPDQYPYPRAMTVGFGVPRSCP